MEAAGTSGRDTGGGEQPGAPHRAATGCGQRGWAGRSRRAGWRWVAAAGLVLASCRPAQGVTPLSDWRTGIATNYGGPADGKSPYSASWGTLEGSCGYGKLDQSAWPYWSVAALSTQNMFYQAGPISACGQCFEITCMDTAPFSGRCTLNNKVSVVVQITDACPECSADHIDIQALTYDKLAPMSTGRISIKYRRVECAPPKPMIVFVDNNGGQGNWLRLFVVQAGGQAAVKSVQVRGPGGGFVNLINKWGSAWETPNAPPYPLDVNIIGADGQAVTALQVIKGPGQLGTFPTSVQFHITNPGDQALTLPAGSSSATTDVGATPVGASAAAASPPPGAGTGLATASAGSAGAVAANATAGVSAGAAAGAGGCSDTPPSTFWTCQQQKDWNACTQGWMTSTGPDAPQGYCAKTCGRCSGATAGVNATAGSPQGPAVQAASLPQAPAAGQGAPCNCNDDKPWNSQYDCAQQLAFGACSQGFMTQTDAAHPYGFCALTCKRCPCTKASS